MYRKLFSTLFLATVVFLVGNVAATAQTSPVRGEVKLKKADGTLVPVADAVVDVYRTDIAKGNPPSSKTNKKGEFSFVGFPVGQTFALAVSGAGIGPKIEPGVKAGRENIVIIVNEGDGRKLTEAEVREVLTSAANIPTGELTAAQKKEREEQLKKNAEITEKNKKLQDGDAIASKANTDGVAALKAKNYDLAIAKFAEGVAAVPDFVGSTPVMLNGKMVSHKARGFDSYIEGAKSADANLRKSKYEAANKDFDEGLAAFDQAMTVVKAAPVATDTADQKNRASVKMELLANALEVHRLKAVTGIDSTKTAQASVVAEEYISLEPDAAKKTAAKVTLGDIMRAAGEFDKAIATYKSVLEAAPDNNEVMASLGLSLVALGTSVEPANKEQLQEGLNYMQKYADTVAILPTDPKQVQEFKQSVKDTVEYLKTEQKLKPQAPPKPTGRRKT
jgi:tetratricopeptide (TPR) repeat protein